MTERGGAIIFCRILTTAMPPPPLPQTPQYLTILMTERGRHYLCRILTLPIHPLPLAPQYCSILMTERGGAIIFCRILAPPIAPPPPQTPQYLTILMTRISAPLMTPPPPRPQNLTILMTERGDAIIFCRILAPPIPPPQTSHYLTILMTGRGGLSV